MILEKIREFLGWNSRNKSSKKEFPFEIYEVPTKNGSDPSFDPYYSGTVQPHPYQPNFYESNPFEGQYHGNTIEDDFFQQMESIFGKMFQYTPGFRGYEGPMIPGESEGLESERNKMLKQSPDNPLLENSPGWVVDSSDLPAQPEHDERGMSPFFGGGMMGNVFGTLAGISPGTSYTQESINIRVRPDGRVEETRTYKDNTGKEQTTTTVYDRN